MPVSYTHLDVYKRQLLYKQLRLVCQPMTLVFCLFGVMLLIPAYPYTFMWFYGMLGLFFSFLNGREQKDVYYSALPPIRKRDTVKANCLFVGLIELLADVYKRQAYPSVDYNRAGKFSTTKEPPHGAVLGKALCS